MNRYIPATEYQEAARISEATDLKNTIGSLKWRLLNAKQDEKPVILDRRIVADTIRRLERLEKLERLVLEANQ